MGKLIQKSPLSEQLYNLTPLHMTIAPYSSEEIDNLNNELNQAREQYTNAIIEYKELIDKYTALESDLNSQINDYRTQVEELNSQVKTMEDKISSTDSANTPVVNHNCLLILPFSNDNLCYYDFTKSMSYDELGALNNALKSLKKDDVLYYGNIVVLNDNYYTGMQSISDSDFVAFWSTGVGILFDVNGQKYDYSSLMSRKVFDFDIVDLQITSCAVSNYSSGELFEICFTLIPVNKTVVEIPSDTSESDDESKPKDSGVVHNFREFRTTNLAEASDGLFNGELNIELDEQYESSAGWIADIKIESEYGLDDFTAQEEGCKYSINYAQYCVRNIPTTGTNGEKIRSIYFHVPVDYVEFNKGYTPYTLRINYTNAEGAKQKILANIEEV